MHDEMPGFFPGRPGGEHDEPLLDMLLERCPIPPGAPPEMHDLARLLAAAAGPAEPGDLELRPEPGSVSSHPLATLEWARQWPCEEVWKARKVRRNA